MPTVLVASLVLIAFLALDLWHYRNDRLISTVGETDPPLDLHVRGTVNLVLIAGVIAAILGAALWKPGIAFDITAPRSTCRTRCATSCCSPSRSCRSSSPTMSIAKPTASPGPDRGVAILFAGIFACIIPVLAMLQVGKDGSFAWLLAAVTAGDGSPHEVATSG